MARALLLFLLEEGREKKGIHGQNNKKKKQRTSAGVKRNTKVRKDS